MIDLTPLDVRKKRGDFAKALRGYEAQEVDVFLELVAECMEALVKENLQLRERSERLGEQVKGQEGREQAVQEALVTAQELRQGVKEQAEREAALLEREACGRIEKMMQEADALLNERRAALEELERHRTRFLKAFRTLLEREMDSVEVESARTPLGEGVLDFELGRGSWSTEGDAEELTAADVNGEAEDGAEESEGGAASEEEVLDLTSEMSPENALWLSSILKRDQQGTE
jgi:cell division initiation protein